MISPLNFTDWNKSKSFFFYTNAQKYLIRQVTQWTNAIVCILIASQALFPCIWFQGRVASDTLGQISEDPIHLTGFWWTRNFYSNRAKIDRLAGWKLPSGRWMDPFGTNTPSIGPSHSAELIQMPTKPNAGGTHPRLSDAFYLELLRRRSCSQTASRKTGSRSVDGWRNDKLRREA